MWGASQGVPYESQGNKLKRLCHMWRMRAMALDRLKRFENVRQTISIIVGRIVFCFHRAISQPSLRSWFTSLFSNFPHGSQNLFTCLFFRFVAFFFFLVLNDAGVYILPSHDSHRSGNGREILYDKNATKLKVWQRSHLVI